MNKLTQAIIVNDEILSSKKEEAEKAKKAREAINNIKERGRIKTEETFIEDFVKEKVEKQGVNAFGSLVHKMLTNIPVMNNHTDIFTDSFFETHEKELKKFKNKYNEYSDITINKEALEDDLDRAITNEIVKQVSSINALLSVAEYDYGISVGKYKTGLISWLKGGLTISSLASGLLKGTEKGKSFLEESKKSFKMARAITGLIKNSTPNELNNFVKNRAGVYKYFARRGIKPVNNLSRHLEESIYGADNILLGPIKSLVSGDKKIPENVKESINKMAYPLAVQDKDDIKTVFDFIKSKEDKWKLFLFLSPTLSLQDLIDIKLIPRNKKDAVLKKYYKELGIKDKRVIKHSLGLDANEIILNPKIIKKFIDKKGFTDESYKFLSDKIDVDVMITDNEFNSFRDNSELIIFLKENTELGENANSFIRGNFLEIKDGTDKVYYQLIRTPSNNGKVELKEVGKNNTYYKDKDNLETRFIGADELLLLFNKDNPVNILEKNLFVKKLKNFKEAFKSKEHKVSDIEELEIRLNELDSSGEKFGVKAGTSFITESKNKGTNTFQISNILTDEYGVNQIYLSNGEGPFTPAMFAEVFKETESKRVASIDTIDELLGSINSEKKQEWENVKVKNNKFKQELEISKGNSEGKKKYFTTKYFLGKHGNGKKGPLLYIHKINGNKAIISTGEGIIEKKGNNTNYKFEINKKKKQQVFLHEIGDFIKNDNLNPVNRLHAQRAAKEAENESKQRDIKKGGMLKGIFKNRSSLLDIFGSFQSVVDRIAKKFKEGGERHASIWAKKLAKKLGLKDIEEGIDSERQKVIVRHVNDLMDKWSTDDDSGPATIEILEILQNKHSTQEEICAAILWPLKKYGKLYEKKLAPYRGKFLFYKALGGKPNDSFHLALIKQYKGRTPPEDVTEEILVWRYSKKLCDEGIMEYHRFHKVLKGLRAKGEQEEFETGKTETAQERQYGERRFKVLYDTVKYGLGGLEPALILASTKEDGGVFPFVWIMSGVATHEILSEDMTQLKNLPIHSGFLNAHLLRFMASSTDINNIQDLIVEISAEIEGKLGNRYPTILEDAKKLRKNGRMLGSSEETTKLKNVENAEKFWDKYGGILSDVLNFNNECEDPDLAKVILAKQEEPLYKWYKQSLRDFEGEVAGESNPAVRTKFTEERWSGVSSIFVHTLAKNILAQTSDGSFNAPEGAIVFLDEYYKGLNTIKSSNYSDETKRELLTDYLQEFLSALSLKGKTSKIREFFPDNDRMEKILGIGIKDLPDTGEANRLRKGEHSDIINSAIEHVLTNNLDELINDTSGGTPEAEKDPLTAIINIANSKTSKVMDPGNSSNDTDNEYKIAA